MLLATKLLLSIYLGVSIAHWLQPPVYAGIAIGYLIGLIVDLATDNARRKD
jgi:hypothetical protein